MKTSFDKTKSKPETRSSVRQPSQNLVDEKTLHKQLLEEIQPFKEQMEKKSQKSINKMTFDEMKKVYAEILKEQKTGLAKVFSDFGTTLRANLMSGISSTFNAGINQYIGAFQQYMSNITTRLVGTQKNYQSVFDSLQRGIGVSSTTNMITVLSNLNRLVSQGITYNIEQRAFLESVSDRIAATFDTMDATLTQLIRLNRGDSTIAYLGMESGLTEFFNSQFADSSYLTALRDSVSSAIYNATSQLGITKGAEFEFQVQKWLGSFYSSGMRPDTIGKLATAIGYLGSGNVSALTSDTSMNNLIAMASNYSGLNYSDLLTQGLTSDTVNQLLYGVYRQGIEMSQSGNLVAQQQYAELFGMNVADLRALAQLTTSDIISLTNTAMTYQNMLTKTAYELERVTERTPIQARLENLISNVIGQVGDNIANNAVSYLTYRLADMVGEVQIPIPFVGPVDAANLIKTAVVGINILSSLGDIVSAFGNNGLNLSNFNSAQVLGSGYISGIGTQGRLVSGTSAMTYYASSDTDTMLSTATSSTSGSVEAVTSSSESSSDKLIDIDMNVSLILKLLQEGILVKEIINNVKVDMQEDSFSALLSTYNGG